MARMWRWEAVRLAWKPASVWGRWADGHGWNGHGQRILGLVVSLGRLRVSFRPRRYQGIARTPWACPRCGAQFVSVARIVRAITGVLEQRGPRRHQ